MSSAARAAGDPAAAARWHAHVPQGRLRPLRAPHHSTTDEGKYSIVWIAVLHGSFTDGSDWIYLMIARGSHDVISQGASTTPFDTSMFRLQGRTRLH